MYIIGNSLGSFWMLCSLLLDSIYGRFQLIQIPALLFQYVIKGTRIMKSSCIALFSVTFLCPEIPIFLTEASCRLDMIWCHFQEFYSEPEAIRTTPETVLDRCGPKMHHPSLLNHYFCLSLGSVIHCAILNKRTRGSPKSQLTIIFSLITRKA